jgi:diacylglycerol kinase family enzyme
MTGQRWLARLAFLLIAAAIAFLIAFAGVRSLALVLIGAIGPCVMLAGSYWFVTNKGLVRWLAFALAVLAPAAVIAAYARRHVLWVAIVAVVALVLALISARAAMGSVVTTPDERPAERPKRPFLIMNPRSGGGKVARFKLKEKAESLGAEIALLEGPEVIDVAALARQAIASGADLLGVAGGDGTQALVAGIAAEHDLPYVCISAGTRNHFAMDLGLDRDDPAACLDALIDGVEQRIDLGRIGDRTFVNNASFGAYAELVRSPAYRDDKRGTTLQLLPDLLKDGNGSGHHLSARVSGTVVDGPQAILVSNNTYQTTDIAGLGRRTGLAGGALGVVVTTVDSAAQAVGLVRRGHGSGLRLLAAKEVTVEAGSPEIPVGVDGETIMMPTPVQCAIVPRALRVVVPRNRPGTQPGRQQFSWRRLWQLAGVRRLTDDKVPGLPRNGYRDITAVELRDMMAGPGL